MRTDIKRLRPSIMSFKILILNIFIFNLAMIWGGPAIAAPSESQPRAVLAYADVADLADAAPLVAKARIVSLKTVRLPASDTDSLAENYILVRAEVLSLIRGDTGISPKVEFLIFPPAVKLKRKQSVLLFALPGGKPGHIRLVSRNALQPWTGELEATTRSLVGELLTADAPPAVIAVGDAFHIAGTVAGEGETQIFLKTATGAPVSLSVLHRPGEAPRWGVALGEIVDDTAVSPARGTLLWYRLACALPPALPPASTRSLALNDAEAAARDYRFVLESLGRCGRTL